MNSTRRIEGVLFDLDDTLLDHSGALNRAFAHWATDEGIDAGSFNLKLWREAEKRFAPEPHLGVPMALTRVRRMQYFLTRALPDQVPLEHDELEQKYEDYLACYAENWRLFADTVESLERLRAGFRLGILTNGAAAMQRRKLQEAGLDTKIDAIVVSEEIGYAKPDAAAFVVACARLGLTVSTVLYIGDDPRIDIAGATGAGLHAELLDRRVPNGASILHDLTIKLIRTQDEGRGANRHLSQGMRS